METLSPTCSVSPLKVFFPLNLLNRKLNQESFFLYLALGVDSISFNPSITLPWECKFAPPEQIYNLPRFFFNFAFIIVCIYVIFKLVLHSFLPDFQSHDILGFSSYATLSQNIFLFFFPISLPNQIYWKSIYWNVKKDSSIEIYSNVILYNFENKKPNFQSVALTSPDSRVLGSLSQVHLLWRFSMTMSKNRALFWAPSSEFLDDLRGNSCHLPSAFFLPEKWGKCHLLIFRKVRRLMRGQWSLQACSLQRQVPWT